MVYGVFEPSMLFSQRVFQNISLPLKNARFDAGVAGRLDVGPLLARPVFVVTDREKDLVLEQFGAAAVGVDAGGVADVVAVSLQEADHRILGAEEDRSSVALSRVVSGRL